MQIILHRVNSIERLKAIDPKYGVEIDIRADGKNLILNHEPFASGDTLDAYLKAYNHAFIIFNIKEAGIEQAVIDLAVKHHIKNYFLLDVEFPYIYRAAREGVRDIAMRYSEDESIETVLNYKDMVDWIWIDTNTQLPLNSEMMKQMEGFKTCLVCPERWGRPEDIPVYIQQMQQLNFPLNAVMTAESYVEQWERYANS